MKTEILDLLNLIYHLEMDDAWVNIEDIKTWMWPLRERDVLILIEEACCMELVRRAGGDSKRFFQLTTFGRKEVGA